MAIDQMRGRGGDSNANPEVNVQKTRNFIQETITELKKTTWPSKAEATRLTAVVLGVIVVLGVYMGLLDWVLSTIVNKFQLLK